jgi:hypothetical protein
MSTNTLDQIVNHLQFLGYEITQKDELRLATHPQKMNVMLRAFKGGILFTSINSCEDRARSDKIGYLSFINSLNNQASVARFYADKDSDFYIEAWYPDSYDRNKFGIFLDAWETDTVTLLLAANREEAFKYLK